MIFGKSELPGEKLSLKGAIKILGIISNFGNIMQVLLKVSWQTLRSSNNKKSLTNNKVLALSKPEAISNTLNKGISDTVNNK